MTKWTKVKSGWYRTEISQNHFAHIVRDKFEWIYGLNEDAHVFYRAIDRWTGLPTMTEAKRYAEAHIARLNA